VINSRIQIALISGLLIALGVGLTLYKAVSLNLPLLPGEYREVWTVESKTSFTPSDGPVNVGLRLPASLAGWTILDEHFVSSGFGFSIIEEPATVSTARWTRQSLDHPTTLYYKMQIYRDRADRQLPDLEVEVSVKPLLEADQQAAMDRVVQRIRKQSSDRESFTLLLLQELLRESQDQDIQFLLSSYGNDSLALILHSLASADIPAHELSSSTSS
jgi:hypothetical protein